MFCSECGQEVEPGARFCGACGAEVVAEATVEPGFDADPGEQVAPPAEADRAGRGRRLGVVLPLVAGGIALVVVAALLLQGLAGDSGGASSPEAAVSQLVAAAQKKDVAAAIATVDPDEVVTLTELYETLDHDLAGSDTLGAGGGDGNQVGIGGLQMHEERMGPGVVRVRVTSGVFHTLLKAGTLPGGVLDSDRRVELEFDSAPGPAGEGLYVMTREVDGHWYVSPTMTALQFLVDREELPPPDFGAATAATGSAQATATPSKLMSSLAQAINDRDVSQLLDLVSSEEASAVRPYTAALQQLLGEVGGSLEIQVTDSDFSEHDLGSGLVRLDLTHAAADAYIADEYDSQQASLKLNGFCVNALSSDGYSSDGCDTQVHRLFGVNAFFTVARREDGGLRLAPIATLLEYSRLLADKLGSDGVRRATGAVAKDEAGTLTPGSAVSGSLNDAGYAVLSYDAAKPGLLAVEADQYVALLDESQGLVEPMACPNGVQVYELEDAGKYHVVVGSGEYRPGSYQVTAEPVQPATADVSTGVSGSIGSGVRLAAFTLTSVGQEEELTFNTSDPVESAISEPEETQGYCAGNYQGEVDQVLGPLSLFKPLESFEPLPTPSRGSGTAYEYYVGYGRGLPYLFVSGAPGTSFSGSFSMGSY